MEVIRQPTTGGTPVEFQLGASGSRFLAENFTSGYATCGILMVATPSITTPAATAATTQEV